MRKLFLSVVLFSALFLPGCRTGLFYRQPTTDHIKITRSGTHIVSAAETINVTAEKTAEVAHTGAKETGEEVSRQRFITIQDSQKEISRNARLIVHDADIILSRSRGELRIAFTAKLILWIVVSLFIMAILSYFGLDRFVKSVIRFALSPLESLIQKDLELHEEVLKRKNK